MIIQKCKSNKQAEDHNMRQDSDRETLSEAGERAILCIDTLMKISTLKHTFKKSICYRNNIL